ncbi:MAG: DUF1080 domain-containing protein [Sedimentisphaerales bacterium]|nr:DUF1080 domain-containing protein [Sedimentisphaerales bacterium]
MKGITMNRKIVLFVILAYVLLPSAQGLAQTQPVPEGFIPLFNGHDLTGWKGLLKSPYDNPIRRAGLSDQERKQLQAQADELMRKHWIVKDGVLCFDGKGFSLVTVREDYADFELLVDWKLVTPKGDSGLYLRGSPQVQIWDPEYRKIGSGGLYNNQKNPSNPLKIADKAIGEWNTFRIKMIGERVTVHLNSELVVDNVVMENYWDRNRPIFPTGQIELQCHGDPICFRNIFIREIPRPGQWKKLFNGRDMAGWTEGAEAYQVKDGAILCDPTWGVDVKGYKVEDGTIACKPGGNLYTLEEFTDFHFKFEFKLTPGANNGLGIRTGIPSHAAYDAMELQILDNTAEKYKNLQPYQYHGSVYGVVPAKRGFLKPIGEWNKQEVIAKGPQITVILNGETIIDADVLKASKNGTDTMDHRDHPGLKRMKGHIAFLGHGDVLWFRNMEVMELK